MTSITATADRRPVGGIVLVIGVIGAAMIYLFWDGLAYMVHKWSNPEYSHGYLIPFIAAFLAFQRSPRVSAVGPKSSWLGPVIFLIGLLSFAVGELSTIYTIVQYAFLVCLVGVAVAVLGRAGTVALWPAFAYLVFMIPLPNFIEVNLSAQLQLWSSALGVAIIRLFSIPVFLDGNVIDLGTYQLQVAEACSGLRYLFPLMSFGFLAACFYRGPVWQRVVLFLSTIPITLLMNSLRVGLIGITVDRWGIEAAEGFLHLFEGWFIFMACLVVLLAEMAVLRYAGGDRGRLADAFAIDLPRISLPAMNSGGIDWRRQGPLVACVVLLAAAIVGAGGLAERTEIEPAHQPFVLFPTEIGEWQGRTVPLQANVLNALKLDDYFNIDYRHGDTGQWVNFYVAYYGSQRKGASAHSPRTCIPGGGWEINSIRQITLDIAGPDGRPLRANRLVISKGTDRELVYYWFQQRGRVVTNEFLVKWYILFDSIVKHRTDGALVRLVTSYDGSEPQGAADQRLAAFAAEAYPKLATMIPE